MIEIRKSYFVCHSELSCNILQQKEKCE